MVFLLLHTVLQYSLLGQQYNLLETAVLLLEAVTLFRESDQRENGKIHFYSLVLNSSFPSRAQGGKQNTSFPSYIHKNNPVM